jgi:hypothetical protein
MPSGCSSDRVDGTWRLDGDELVVTSVALSNDWIWPLALAGDTLTPAVAGMASGPDGVRGPDPADHNMSLVR